MTIVVQGFEPFADHAINPSGLLVSELARQARPGVVAEVLPTSRERVSNAVAELIATHRPSAWIGVGLAAGRCALSVEAVAINLADWTVADADGTVAEREPILADGPDAHLTTLPVSEILAGWRDAGVPGALSLSAGSYICNLSFYLAAQAVAELGLSCRVGFIHVPLLPEMTEARSRPSMSMSLMSDGLDRVIEASAGAPGDAGLYPRRIAA